MKKTLFFNKRLSWATDSDLTPMSSKNVFQTGMGPNKITDVQCLIEFGHALE